MKKKIRSAMVNLHIGGAISVFFICVGLLACDRWFNNSENIDFHVTETDGSSLEASTEFVSAPPRHFLFSQQRGTNGDGKVNGAVWPPDNSEVEQGANFRVQSIQQLKFAPDSKLFVSDIEQK